MSANTKHPYPAITPYLINSNSVGVLEFLKKAFDAKEIHLEKYEDGSIRHATLGIGDSMVMLSEATENFPAMPAMIYVYLGDCDTFYNRAIAAGGVSLREPANEAYGDRSSGVKDLAGNQWWIAGPVK